MKERHYYENNDSIEDYKYNFNNLPQLEEINKREEKYYKDRSNTNEYEFNQKSFDDLDQNNVNRNVNNDVEGSKYNLIYFKKE